MKKRTYGTGTYTPVSNGKWLLQYKPKWSPKRLNKRIEPCTEKAAEKQLSDWVAELDGQEGPKVLVSIDDLIALHVADMVLEGCEPQNILDTERKEKKHLGKFFAAHDFTTPLKKADIKRYKTARRKAKAAPATVNRELSWLHRCLVLGNDEELTTVAIPKFEKFDEAPFVRMGTISDENYYAILRALPRHSQPVWCISFRTGVRKGEMLKLQTAWLLPHWKKEDPYIEIPGFDAKGNRITKSGKPHVIPLWHPEMRSMLEMTLSDPTRDPKCPYLFQYRGKRIKSIRTGFEKAREMAGLDGQKQDVGKVLFHDSRRSAASMMDALGIDEEEGMAITGHLTPSMYRRYQIGRESKAVATGRKLAAATISDKFATKFATDRPGQEAERLN